MRNSVTNCLLGAVAVLLAANLAGVTKQEARANSNGASIVGIAASADADANGKEKRYLYRLWSDGRIDELVHPGYANPSGTLQYKWFTARWAEVELEHSDRNEEPAPANRGGI